MTVSVDIEPALAPLPSATVEADQDTLVVVVKPEHIAQGAMWSQWRCPVALALKDSGVTYVRVSHHSVQAGGRLWWTGDQLCEWIQRFDNGLPVEPERFVLRRVR